jgi:hypothetical protein
VNASTVGANSSIDISLIFPWVYLYSHSYFVRSSCIQQLRAQRSNQLRVSSHLTLMPWSYLTPSDTSTGVEWVPTINSLR